MAYGRVDACMVLNTGRDIVSVRDILTKLCVNQHHKIILLALATGNDGAGFRFMESPDERVVNHLKFYSDVRLRCLLRVIGCTHVS